MILPPNGPCVQCCKTNLVPVDLLVLDSGPPAVRLRQKYIFLIIVYFLLYTVAASLPAPLATIVVDAITSPVRPIAIALRHELDLAQSRFL